LRGVPFLLRLDPITVNRPNAGADADGNPESGFTVVPGGRGTLGTPTAADQQIAAQRETKVDQVLAVARSMDLRAADQVGTPRGTFVVVSVAVHRLYLRAMLRRVA
jgi:hypothetical protein